MRKVYFGLILPIAAILTVIGAKTTTFLAPMEDAMNPVIKIAGTEEDEINCNVPQNANNQYTFEVDYTDTRSTEEYIMNSIDYAPLLDFDNVANLGTAIDFSAPDYFSETINFFPFSFFDQTTNDLAIGENGLISLDPQQGGQINLRYPSANIPNSTLTRNSIFAAHYDLRIDDIAGAAVYYKIIGSYPARKMVITYRNAEVFYCTDNRTTSVQVVLEELTNKIQIFIKDKAIACGAVRNAVVGIQDRYGNLGYSPSGKNYDDGDWSATNEAYEFVPNGERIPSISWIEGAYTQDSPDNNIIGTGEQITVNADLTDLQYTVEVRYPNYRNELGEIVDLVLTDIIEVSENYPIGIDESVVICSNTVDLTDYNEFISLNPHQNFTITYYYDQALTNPVPNQNNFSFTGEEITVYAEIAYDANCIDVAALEISSVLGLMQIDANNLEVYVCDNVNSQNNEGTENSYQLSNLNDLIMENVPNGTINYYNSANSNTPITQSNINDGTQVWMDVTVSGNNGCTTPRIGPITIRFYDVPEFLNIPTNLELVICDKNFNDREEFDQNQTWQSFLADNGLVTNNSNHTITVYETEQNAIDGTNALSQVTMDPNDPTYDAEDNSRYAQLFIRIEDENGCFSVEEINCRIRFYGVDATDTPTFNLCVAQGNTIDLDLSCYLADADFSGDGNFDDGMFTQIFFEDGTTSDDINDVYEITYHSSNNDANAGNNPISNLQEISTDQVGTINFYVRFTLCESCTPDNDDCYTVKRIRFRVISTVPNSPLDVCHENDGDTYVENLNIFNFQLIENQGSYSISYYENQNDAQNRENEITSYTFTGDDFLWVYIESNFQFIDTSCHQSPVDPCGDIYRIRFIYGAVVEPIDFPEQQINGVCDNNADGTELYDVTIFEDSIYSGEATFEYFGRMNEDTFALSQRIADPTQVPFTGENGSATRNLFIRLSYADNACYEIVRLTITLNFIPAIETHNGFLCACLPNPGEYSTFDLTSAIDQIFLPVNEQNNNELSDMNISYYNYYLDAEEGNPVAAINNPTNYQSIRGDEEIFVRFFSTESQCYSIDTLTLKNLVLPTPIPGEIEVCDTNINGDYDIILSDLNEIVMPGNTASYFFSYYFTLQDAQNGNNAIIQTPEDLDDSAAFFYEFDTMPDEIFVRVDADNGDCAQSAMQNGSSCSDVNVVTLVPGTSINANQFEYELPEICDTFTETGEFENLEFNDGIASGIDLTVFETEIYNDIGLTSSTARLLYYKSLNELESDSYPYGENVIVDPQNFTNASNNGTALEQVFVKIEYSDHEFCPIIITLNINVIDGPKILPEEEYYICPDGMVDIELNFPEGETPENYTYEWILPDGTTIVDQHQLLGMTQIGSYAVRITDMRTNCSTPLIYFLVKEIDAPQIIELIVYNESEIEVIATGFDDLELEYSIDGENFQSSNQFTGLEEGVYTIWVRYNYNNQMCLGEPKSTILLKINNIITPNGDGYNDCLSINNLTVFGESNSTFIVYDRYGKEIFAEKNNTVIEWCGRYGGRVLPTTNYWYKLILPDGREKSGFITLKNY